MGGLYGASGVLGCAIVKLLILGATGRLGRQLVTQALEKGHDITILARDRSKVELQHERLRVVEGDARNTAALSDAMRGQMRSSAPSAAACPSNPSTSWNKRARHSRHDAGEWHQAVDVHVGNGVGESYRDAPVMPKIFFRTLLRGIYADKAIGERMIRNSALEWTIVQPAHLNDRPLTKNYRAGESVPLSGMPQISRADTAHFILDRLHDPSTIRKTLILAD
jgi:putative NADH-flavin reductase